MIGLRKGQEVKNFYKAQSKLGLGTLYVLNTGICYELKGKGVALELSFSGEFISCVSTKKDRIKITWDESGQKHDMECIVPNAGTIISEMESAKNNYDKTVTNLSSI